MNKTDFIPNKVNLNLYFVYLALKLTIDLKKCQKIKRNSSNNSSGI